MDEYTIEFEWRFTVPADQVQYERPVVTITWLQPPFDRKPRLMRWKVPKDLVSAVQPRGCLVRFWTDRKILRRPAAP